MLIDHRFLNPHPATLDWWDQRDQCTRCIHLDLRIEGQKDRTEVLRCRVTRTLAGRKESAYCIDARSAGRPCGPDALLFEAKA